MDGYALHTVRERQGERSGGCDVGMERHKEGHDRAESWEGKAHTNAIWSDTGNDVPNVVGGVRGTVM